MPRGVVGNVNSAKVPAIQRKERVPQLGIRVTSASWQVPHPRTIDDLFSVRRAAYEDMNSRRFAFALRVHSALKPVNPTSGSSVSTTMDGRSLTYLPFGAPNDIAVDAAEMQSGGQRDAR